jgi:pyruvate ferredoxin oxidoreductase delta subunit
LLVVSRRTHDDLMPFLARRPFPYRMTVLEGDASFSGLWVFRDDFTRERVLGAIAAVDPGVISIDAVCDYLLETTKQERRANAAREAHAAALEATRPVTPEKGIDWPHAAPPLPAWQEFDEGVVIRAVPRRSGSGPRSQARNAGFQHGTSKTERPVVRFDRCIKCTLCWLMCPEGCFDPVDGGYYDVDYEYCTGCAKCAAICPVADCISMVNELQFTDSRSPWLDHQRDPAAYVAWIEDRKSAGLATYDYIPGAMPSAGREALEAPAKAQT